MIKLPSSFYTIMRTIFICAISLTLLFILSNVWTFISNIDELPINKDSSKITSEFSYQGDDISANLFISNYFKQTHTAALETSTDSYVMVDVNVNYHFTLGQHDLAVYLKGKNLTDEYAQVHTSFLKDLTPLAGRSIAVGIRGSF